MLGGIRRWKEPRSARPAVITGCRRSGSRSIRHADRRTKRIGFVCRTGLAALKGCASCAGGASRGSAPGLIPTSERANSATESCSAPSRATGRRRSWPGSGEGPRDTVRWYNQRATFQERFVVNPTVYCGVCLKPPNRNIGIGENIDPEGLPCPTCKTQYCRKCGKNGIPLTMNGYVVCSCFFGNGFSGGVWVNLKKEDK
jgi:hypothetical protein